MSQHQDAIRERIRRLSRVTGKSFSALSREARIAPSTLTRFMNDPAFPHVLSTRTLAKLDALSRKIAPGYEPGRAPGPQRSAPEDPALLTQLGRRMRLVRRAIARNMSDEDVARLFGWSTDQMEAIFAGMEAPSLSDLIAFATRMNVTVDFLLSESLEGLPRSSERVLIAAEPKLGLAPDRTVPGTDTHRA